MNAISNQATPRPWFAGSYDEDDDDDFSTISIGPFDLTNRPLQDHVEEVICHVYENPNLGIDRIAEANAALIVAAVNSYDESRKLLREAQKLYENLDAVTPPHEFDRFEKHTIEFSGGAINELRATLARITAHLEAEK